MDGAWQAVARAGLRDAAQQIQRRIAERALLPRARGGSGARVERWVHSVRGELSAWQRTLGEMRAAGPADFATLSVGVDAVRRLAD